MWRVNDNPVANGRQVQGAARGLHKSRRGLRTTHAVGRSDQCAASISADNTGRVVVSALELGEQCLPTRRIAEGAQRGNIRHRGHC